MGFGKTKGEIRVKKRDFRGNLGGWLRGLDLVWESATPPTHIWKNFKKKTFFFETFPYSPVHVRTTVSKPWNRWGGGGWWDGMGHLVTSVHVILSSHENIHILNFLVKYLQTRFIFHKKLDIFPTDVNPRYLLHFECLRLFCC